MWHVKGNSGWGVGEYKDGKTFNFVRERKKK